MIMEHHYAQYKPLLPADAPKEVTEIYDEFRRKMGFPSPPNFIMTQGHSPTVVKGVGIWSATFS